jgi:hypothetical protein
LLSISTCPSTSGEIKQKLVECLTPIVSDHQEARAKVTEVGPGGYSPPRHPTHFEPSFLELNNSI